MKDKWRVGAVILEHREVIEGCTVESRVEVDELTECGLELVIDEARERLEQVRSRDERST